MHPSACESCVLRCDLMQVQETLPKIIADAEEQLALNRVGVDVAWQAFDETVADVSLEHEMEKLTDVRDDSVTAAAKASERYDVFKAVTDIIEDSVAHMPNHLEVASRGPIELQTAGELQHLLELGCTGGPKRGLRIPLTNIVVPLPGGRGKEYCASGPGRVVQNFLGQLSARYASVLPGTSGNPDA